MDKTSETYSIKQIHLKNALMYTLPVKGVCSSPISLLRNIFDDMSSYISRNGAKSIGPLIMKSAAEHVGESENHTAITYIQQADTYIENIEAPYKIERDIIIPYCMHLQFSGKENDFIYLFFQTLSMIRYENMLPSKEVYIMFISQTNDDDNIIGEVYVPMLLKTI